jgi:hypothetical protein
MWGAHARNGEPIAHPSFFFFSLAHASHIAANAFLCPIAHGAASPRPSHVAVASELCASAGQWPVATHSASGLSRLARRRRPPKEPTPSPSAGRLVAAGILLADHAVRGTCRLQSSDGRGCGRGHGAVGGGRGLGLQAVVAGAQGHRAARGLEMNSPSFLDSAARLVIPQFTVAKAQFSLQSVSI